MKKSYSIFIVDDDKISRYIAKNRLQEICSNLRKKQIFYKEFGDGLAVKHFLLTSNTLPDLILLDINMPVMDGIEFLKWLRSENRFANCKVVVCTSSLMEEDEAKVESLGIQGFFVKPLSNQQLISCISFIHPEIFH